MDSPVYAISYLMMILCPDSRTDKKEFKMDGKIFLTLLFAGIMTLWTSPVAQAGTGNDIDRMTVAISSNSGMGNAHEMKKDFDFEKDEIEIEDEFEELFED